MQCDWILQDHGRDFLDAWLQASSDGLASGLLQKMTQRVLTEVKAAGSVLPDSLATLAGVRAEPTPGRLLDLYDSACRLRRRNRLLPLLAVSRRILFAKHFNLGGSHYAYTEGQSDAQRERHFHPGTALCVLHVDDGLYGRVETLLDDPKGVIRDPDVSSDAQRVLFAWKKADREDDYHLYEMPFSTREIRQLTFGLGVADYEGQYLPDGDIIFNSTRCVQTVDCWWTEVSNLYRCSPDGKGLRRLTFDQVHTNFPTVMQDGRVIYTRWEYNDRGQLYPQPLFQMNPDGTGQTEFYGNNSWFPTTILHARGIPGTDRVVAIATGHHTRQAGKLAIIDRRKGTQENQGVTLIAPRRETKAVRVDRYGQDGELFQYPYPLGDDTFLVSYTPYGWEQKPTTFAIYLVTADGRRELLAADPTLSCTQPVPLSPRPPPHLRPSMVDYRKSSATCYLQDIHVGPGLAGIPRGSVRRLRVVALDYRAAGINSNRNHGPAGGALVSTPVATDNGSWDVKTVLGEADVYDDGSAFFLVPARTPVYFQALDAKRHVVQTMRSWATLQPGETASCVGCHEAKHRTPVPRGKPSAALSAGPQELEPFYGPARGFSFIKEIQPILDKHCIRCHHRPASASSYSPSASHTWGNDTALALSDKLAPKNSDDHAIPRHTWWNHKGTSEWAQYDFEKPKTVAAVSVYWFDDRPRGGGCRVPESWRLLYRNQAGWQAVGSPTAYGVERDTFNTVSFTPVTMTGLRLDVQLQAKFSSGILEWRVKATGKDEDTAAKPNSAFSLLGTQHAGNGGRRWSEAYLALTHKGRETPLVNWISAQSVPPMLSPYHKGAAKSALIAMLREGHQDVKLAQEDIDKLACWIDLLVPYCGDYTEANAWSDEEQRRYAHFLAKRRKIEALERQSIQALPYDTTP